MTKLEEVTAAVESEIDTVPAVLADPMTIRRIRAKRIAIAAVRALREPTEEMEEAGNIPGWDDSVTHGLSGEVWRAMIDSILADTEEGR